MRKWFAVGVLWLVVFEFANVWFIMPLPFSQRVRSIDLAYALYTWRWAARAVFGTLLLAGLVRRGAPRGGVAGSCRRRWPSWPAWPTRPTW